MSLVMGVIGAIVVIAGFSALSDEFQVADAQSLLLAQMPRPSAEAVAPLTIDPAMPPRAQVIDALRLAGAAAQEADVGRRATMLDTADAALRAAAVRRPQWGDAQIARAYVATQRHGADSAEAVAALSASYATVPFARDAAGWRIATGLAAWDRLDARVRGRVIDEATSMTQTSYRSMIDVVALLRGTPAYGPFMLRWRALRMSDATN